MSTSTRSWQAAQRPRTTTEAVLAGLRERPGIQAPQLAELLDVHPSTADYHLKKLHRKGIVVIVSAGRNRCHYLAGNGWCPTARRVHAHLTDAGRATVARALDEGLVARKDLVTMGHSRSAVRWALAQLQDAGVIERLAWGVYHVPRSVRPCATAAIREAPCTSCHRHGSEDRWGRPGGGVGQVYLR